MLLITLVNLIHNTPICVFHIGMKNANIYPRIRLVQDSRAGIFSKACKRYFMCPPRLTVSRGDIHMYLSLFW